MTPDWMPAQSSVHLPDRSKYCIVFGNVKRDLEEC
ncbi:unnamed protein product [Discula destructiva]